MGPPPCCLLRRGHAPITRMGWRKRCGLQARRLAFKSHFERDDVERELLGGPRGGTGSAGSSGICHERTRSPSSRNRSTAGPLLLLRVMAGTSEL